jgi:hypothetical protein
MKERRQLRRRIPLHQWHGKGIDGERHFNPLLAEPLLYDLLVIRNTLLYG